MINLVFIGGVYLTLNQRMIFFDTFSIEGLKHFIIQDGKKIVEKNLIGTEKMDRSDKKITLCKIKFNMSAYKRLKKRN